MTVPLSPDQWAYVIGLREMVDFLEAHPHMIGSVTFEKYVLADGPTVVDTQARFVELCTELGEGVGTRSNEQYVNYRKAFGPHGLSVFAYKDKIPALTVRDGLASMSAIGQFPADQVPPPPAAA